MTTSSVVPAGSALAIIPARGGSKGVPRKNVRLLAGKPLIAHTIEAALAARRIERVVVSTDDEEIAAVARRCGAEVVLRPAEIAGDGASSEAALLHVLQTLQSQEKYVPEIISFLQCTSPLTLPEDIDGTLDTLLTQQADSAFAVAEFHYFLWQPGELSSTEGAKGINHEPQVRQMRQERKPQYVETGAVYAMRTAGFLHARHRFFGKIALHQIPSERRLEIDDLADFDVAEVRLRRRQQAQMLAQLPRPIDAVVFDFDGVFTDNRVILTEEGQEAAICNRGDGMGISLLQKSGVPLLVLSKERVPIVARRCEKLGLECLHGVDNKLVLLNRWLAARGASLANTVYVGNDVNDLECLAACGCGAVPADAHPAVLSAANLILTQAGGSGAVRELCDLIGQHPQVPRSPSV